MNRIQLSKEKKQTLRILDKGFESCPASYPVHTFSACVDSLEIKGLANGAHLTDAGRTYLALNPHLRNPICWAKISAIASCIAVIVAVVALLVGCSMLK